MPALFPAMYINSDSRHYGGSDLGTGDALEAVPGTWMDQPAQLELVLPPLAGLILIPTGA